MTVREGQQPDTEGAAEGAATHDDAVILIVDDDPTIRFLIGEQLVDRFRLAMAGNGVEALQILDQRDVAVVISDERMPEMTGTELLAAACKVQPDAVRILLTAYGDMATVIKGVNEGHIFYYLTKPWAAHDLSSIVSRGVEHSRLLRERRRLIDELKQANAELEMRVLQRTSELEERTRELEEANRTISELAAKDPLTGAANRRTFLTAMQLELERATRRKAETTVIMIDLDHFKSVNDGWGHAVGDAVLEATAHLLQELARPYDLVARIGGEEFVVLLPSTTKAQGLNVAERLRAEVAAMKVKDYPKVMTASFGVATAVPGDQVPELLLRADEALYRAKHAGRDRVSG